LLDNRILIDFTPTDADMLPEGCKPECIFYTHSHGDHYNPEALLKLGVPAAHIGKTWINRAWKNFADASAKTGLPVPELIPLSIGETIVSGDIRITALPANHAINDTEQALIYLIEKGPVRVIYATDTGGIMGVAARIAGIDPHVKPGNPIHGLIMEATMGMGDKGDEDFRLFTHSSVNTVHRTVKMLLKRKRLEMKEGQSVYLTHLARTLHGTQAELDATLPAPLKAAYDGLEVVFEA
jgi:phosphoribosyl 1,2-cyclic phosphodiesterase